MARSLSHLVDPDTGEISFQTIENTGDAKEALVECFVLIGVLSKWNKARVNTAAKALRFPPIKRNMVAPSEHHDLAVMAGNAIAVFDEKIYGKIHGSEVELPPILACHTTGSSMLRCDGNGKPECESCGRRDRTEPTRIFGHRESCDVFQLDPDGGPSRKPCNCRMTDSSPGECTGVSATWCPVHGVCLCRHSIAEFQNENCPLHGKGSDHPR